MSIIVPISRSVPQGPPGNLRQPPDEPWALMAAAQMHAEGRLLAPDQPKDTPDASRSRR